MHRLLIAALAASAVSTFAAEPRWRDSLSERGVEIGLSAVAELLYSSTAHNWPARLDLSAASELDLGMLTGWSVLDNVYAFALPTVAWGEEEEWDWRGRIYMAWLKWDGSDKWNVLAGRYDPTWDFHSLPSTAPFLRLPSRTGGEFSPGSPGLLDLFPLSPPGVRFEIKPTRHVALQTAALLLESEYELHGRPALTFGDDTPRPLLLGEIAWRTTDEEVEKLGHFHTGLGGWLLTGKGDDSWGAYAFADATLHREAGSAEQGGSAFASASVAGASKRANDWRFAGGITWRGLIAQRDDDITAVAVIHERLGDQGSERTAWELLHRVPLAAESWLQFTVQHQGKDEWRVGLTLGFAR
ncbi:MAG: carbohydrate porin [Chthoniobacter sp.]|nr:carbohydrate porin [Chthoniobacter sp.]